MKTKFNLLPHEIYGEIINFWKDEKSLFKFMLVCKDIYNFFYNSEYSGCEYIIFSTGFFVPNVDLPFIKHILINKGGSRNRTIGNKRLLLYIQKCFNLESLIISNAQVVSAKKIFKYISLYRPTIKCIKMNRIKNIDNIDFSIFDSSTKKCEINSLSFKSCGSIDETFLKYFKNSNYLKSLELKFCMNVKDKIFDFLNEPNINTQLENFTSIRAIGIKSYEKLSQNINLKNLTLKGCFLNDEKMKFLKELKNLENIILSKNKLDGSFFQYLNSKRIFNLNVSYNKINFGKLELLIGKEIKGKFNISHNTFFQYHDVFYLKKLKGYINSIRVDVITSKTIERIADALGICFLKVNPVWTEESSDLNDDSD